MANVVSPSESRLITGEEFYRMPGMERRELIKGRPGPMTPPPGYDHGEVVGNVFAEIRQFVRAHDLGRVATGEAGLYTGRDPDTVRGADVIYISHERYARRTAGVYLDVAPDLIAEVLSPSNTPAAVQEKVEEYLNAGVRLVWLVDPEKRRVTAYRSLTDKRQFAADQDLPGDDVLPGFSIPVARLFE
jgi:Uma2 family endonuclease